MSQVNEGNGVVRMPLKKKKRKKERYEYFDLCTNRCWLHRYITNTLLDFNKYVVN